MSVATGCVTASVRTEGSRPETPRFVARLLADDGARGDNLGGARWFDTYADPVEPVYYATPGESALSSEGTVAVVGAPGASAGGRAGAGAAYVFADRGGSWRQVAKLVASDGAAHDALGWTVAISGAGDEVLVGAPYADIAGQEDQGAAYVFSERSGRWSQTQKIVGPDSVAYSEFGWSVAIARRGAHALIGAPGQPVGSAGAGAGTAHLYRRGDAATPWTAPTRLEAESPSADAQFGAALDLSADGSVVAVSAATHDDRDGALHVGSTTVFGTTDGGHSVRALARFDDPSRNRQSETDAYGVDVTVDDLGTRIAVAAPTSTSTAWSRRVPRTSTGPRARGSGPRARPIACSPRGAPSRTSTSDRPSRSRPTARTS